MNRDYVFARTNQDLTQLYLHAYRTTGLLEHVHASTFFVGIGTLAWLAIYLEYGNKLSLLWMAFCEMILIVHGIRTALIAGCIAVTVLIFLTYKSQPENGRKRWKNILWVLVIAGVSVAVLDPFGTVQKFYFPILSHGNWNSESLAPLTLQNTINHSANTGTELLQRRLGGGWSKPEFFTGLFGHGIGASLIGNVEGLDDDVFIMQIFAQYGLLGGIAFIGLFLAAAVTFWTTFNRAEDSNSILLALAFSLIVLLGLSMLHSGVIQRKAIFTVLLWALAIIYGSSRRGIR